MAPALLGASLNGSLNGTPVIILAIALGAKSFGFEDAIRENRDFYVLEDLFFGNVGAITWKRY